MTDRHRRLRPALLALAALLASATPAHAEEIVVTITKRPEAANRVPASLVVMGEDELEERSVENLSDVLTRIPNVSVQGRNGPVAIRGIAPTQVSGAPGGVASAVAQHVNGIFKPEGELSMAGQFYDLERFELIRGPSGTAYGRSATAGALDLRWRRPHAGWEVFGDATGSRPDAAEFRGGLNLPLLGEGDERLLARLVVQREVGDGIQDDPFRSARLDPENLDDWSARAFVTSRFSEDLRGELRASWHRSKALADQGRAAANTFPTGLVATPFGTFPTMPFAGAEPVRGDPRTVRTSALALGDPSLEVRALDGELRWQLPALGPLGRPVVTALGGWERRTRTNLFDVDGTELVIADGRLDSEATTWTGELRIATDPAERRFHALLGGFVFDDRRRERSANLTPFGPFDVAGDTRDHGSAVFFSGGVRPFALLAADGPDVELFGGIRWNRDRTRVAERIVPGPLSAGGALDGGARFEEWTGEAGVRWQVSPEHGAYLKWATGYKPGLLELIVATGTPNPVAPETIEAVELGTRHAFLEGRARIALTAFWSEYEDLQVLQIRGLQVLTENAARATIRGIEASAVLEPIPGWRLQVDGAFLDAEFGRFCSDDPAQFFALSEPGCPAVATGTGFNGLSNLAGNALQDAPRWSVSVLATGTVSLGRFGTLRPIVEWSWSDERFLRPFALASDRQPAVSSTELRLLWEAPGGRLTAELFGSNLENEVVYGRRSVLPEFAGGFPTGLGLLDTRRFGVRVGFRFGGPPGA